MLAVVVDDILHAVTTSTAIDSFTAAMVSVYKMKNLGVPSLMVDINVTVNKVAIRLNQSHYIRQVA